jgi:hypothetical protein
MTRIWSAIGAIGHALTALATAAAAILQIKRRRKRK